MPPNDARLRAAKPKEKSYKLHDFGGLFCVISPTGGKYWRCKFMYRGKEKVLTLGEYPRIGIVDARKRRDDAKTILDEGRDPAAERRAAKEQERIQALTFEMVARDWWETRRHEWTEKYAAQVMVRLEVDMFPKIGELPIAEITPPVVLAALRKVEARGILATTRRLKQYTSAIFRYAIASGYCLHDPAAPLAGALRPPPRPVHHKSIRRDEVGALLRKIEAYDGEPETRIALQLALLTAVRTSELRGAWWSEFEGLDQPGSALWRIPAERMRMRQPHLVPLSTQTVAALKKLAPLTRKSGRLFLGKGPEGVMSNNTMLFALYRLGYRGRATTHGFRSLFSTEANERGFNADWIERQLAHDERDDVRGAYNAAQYLAQRREMMQWWGDELEKLQAAAHPAHMSGP